VKAFAAKEISFLLFILPPHTNLNGNEFHHRQRRVS
jgi:hypothetical protein